MGVVSVADVVNGCGGCGKDFSSVRAFDSHRVGRHGYTLTEGLRRSPPVEDGRRCLDDDELLEDGQFAQDARGRWYLVERRDAARRAFSVGLDTEQRAA